MDSIQINDELFDYVAVFTENADAALYGRVTWEMMDNYWPTAGDQPNAGKHDKQHSAWYNRVHKFVLSRSMQGQDQDKLSFIGDDMAEKIAVLKQEQGGDIMIFGSPSAAHALMQHDLIDEFRLFVNPVLLGEGIPAFEGIQDRKQLSLQSSKLFSCGVIALNYILKQP